MRYLCALSMVMIGLLTTTAAHGQATATLRGRVRDAQAAPVAAASVTVTSVATGFTRAVPTSSDGSFVLANLPPATLDLTIAAPGFATATRRGLLLEVGQTLVVDVDLALAGVRETLVVSAATTAVDTARSVVDAVIPSTAIEALPLNGRNFLELALLVPGNAPAPNFDPTKTNSVVDLLGRPARSRRQHHHRRRRQQRRRGRRTAAERHPGVGAGIPDRDATGSRPNRGARPRRSSTSSPARAPTSCADRSRSSARRQRWQGLPATYDRSSGDSLPFDRQQVAGAARRSARARARRSGSRPPSTATRTARCWWASATWRPAPSAGRSPPRRSTTCSGRARVDWRPNGADALCLRYAGERADDTGASSLDRAIGSALAAAAQPQHLPLGRRHLDTRDRARRSSTPPRRSFSTFDNAIVPVAPGPQLTFPSMLRTASSFRVPQGTDAAALPGRRHAHAGRAGAHSLRVGGEWQRVDAAVRPRRVPGGPHRVRRRTSPSFDHNGDGRVDDGDLLFAVTLRSGKPDQALVLPDADNDYVALFVQDDWRVRPDLTLNLGLRYEIDTDVKNISRVDEINPIVQPFLQGTRKRDLNNFGSADRLQLGRPATAATSVHGGYGIYYDRITLRDPVARTRPRRPGAAGRGARRQRVLPRPETGQFPPFAPSTANPFTGFILPGAGASGINIIDNTHAEPERAAVQPRRPARVAARTSCCASTACTTSARTSSSAGPIGEVFNPVVGGPDRVVNLESSVNTHYDGLLVSARARAARAAASARRTRFAKAFNYANDDQIPFAQRARSIRTTCSASTDRRPTTSGIASRSPAWIDAAGRAARGAAS